MKLNFEICKNNCATPYKLFKNDEEGFVFCCVHCGNFYFNLSHYATKFNSGVWSIDLTNEEWNDIKEMKIVRYTHEWFNECPFQLEHILDDQP